MYRNSINKKMPDIPAFFVCRKQFLTGSASPVIGFCSSGCSGSTSIWSSSSTTGIGTSWRSGYRCSSIATAWSSTAIGNATGIATSWCAVYRCSGIATWWSSTAITNTTSIGSSIATCSSRVSISCRTTSSTAIASISSSLCTVTASYTGISRSSSVVFISI